MAFVVCHNCLRVDECYLFVIFDGFYDRLDLPTVDLGKCAIKHTWNLVLSSAIDITILRHFKDEVLELICVELTASKAICADSISMIVTDCHHKTSVDKSVWLHKRIDVFN